MIMADKIKTLGGMNQRPMNSRPMNARPDTSTVRKTVSSTPVNNMQRQTPVKQFTQSAGPSSSFGTSAPKKDAAKEANGGVMQMLQEFAGSFATLDEETIRRNIDLAAGIGMTNDDRTVPYEVADYFVGNMAYIIMMIVFDKSVKQQFLDAVALEIQLDSKSESERQKIRLGMRSPTQPHYTASIVLGITNFSTQLEEIISAKMKRGFENLDRFSDEFDAKVNSLTDAEKLEFGFIVSNWMYLIRAITHNDIFSSYLVTIIEQIKDKTK